MMRLLTALLLSALLPLTVSAAEPASVVSGTQVLSIPPPQECW